jgi:hypothetical protein
VTRRRFLLAGAIAIVVIVAGYGLLRMFRGGSELTPLTPISTVEGVVVRVDSAGLGQVKGFDLRLRNGATVGLTIGTLENAAEFPPSHLAEHQVSSEPVRAFYRLEEEIMVVYRLEDAG